MYTQDFSPVSESLGLTSIFAVLPLVTLFVLLGGVKMKAQWASLIALGVAIVVALAVYGMPFDQTALSATEGAALRPFPDHVDRRHGDLGLQHDRRDGPGAAAPVRRHLRGLASRP